MTSTHRVLEIQGWRGIAHSYALVNQFQMLGWLQRGQAMLVHHDMPFLSPNWGKQQNPAGLLESDAAAIEAVDRRGRGDRVYRIFSPLKLEAPDGRPTITFAVSEMGFKQADLPKRSIASYVDGGGLIHTPSRWTCLLLQEAGVPLSAIRVIPHAADPKYFYPVSSEEVEGIRQRLGFTPDDIILLNIGSHFWNKGMDVAVQTFAKARAVNPNLKLIIKEQSATYGIRSDSQIVQYLSAIGCADEITLGSIRTISDHLNLAQINSLYNASDAYFTPYRAEGFNMPALEAQEAGTPVIATRGGATDDFLGQGRNYLIDGRRFDNVSLSPQMVNAFYIEPDQEVLVETLINLQRKIRLKPISSDGWARVTEMLDACYHSQQEVTT